MAATVGLCAYRRPFASLFSLQSMQAQLSGSATYSRASGRAFSRLVGLRALAGWNGWPTGYVGSPLLLFGSYSSSRNAHPSFASTPVTKGSRIPNSRRNYISHLPNLEQTMQRQC
ncbi:hypothetical protein ABW19_dt0209909 [Dactylella cylindrospora]|nr:hypothetical protein ABW19_dt0209909 [Dactylella cylindrospora]